jgi:hypothetical protein
VVVGLHIAGATALCIVTVWMWSVAGVPASATARASDDHAGGAASREPGAAAPAVVASAVVAPGVVAADPVTEPA